jgi:hypothetical protein
MRNSTVLIIAGASAATAAAVPTSASNAVTTKTPITAPQVSQAVQTPEHDSEVWYAGTKPSEDAQSTKAVIIETDEEYEHRLEQAMAVSNSLSSSRRTFYSYHFNLEVQLYCSVRG